MKQDNIKYKSVGAFLWYFVKQRRWVFLLQALLCIAWSIKESLFPYFIKIIVNHVHHGFLVNSTEFLKPFIYLAVIWGIMEIAMRIQGILSLSAFPHLRANVRCYLFSIFLDQSFKTINKHKRGIIINMINHIPHACQTVLETILLNFVSIFGAVLIVMIFLYAANPLFAMLLFVWLLIHLAITYFFTATICEKGLDHADTQNRLDGHINDTFMKIYNIFIFARKSYEKHLLRHQQHSELILSSQAQFIIEKMRIIQSILAIGYIMTMLYFTYNGIVHHWLTLGDAALIPIMSFNVLGMIWWLSQEINICYREYNQINAFLHLLREINSDTCTEHAKNNMSANTSSDTGKIKLNNVSFSYDQKALFTQLNLTIPDKQFVGIVGLSGSGKTSLCNLLCGIYPPDQGQILINNIDINEGDSDSNKNIALVPQDLLLFNRSVADNIKYSNLTASKDEIIAAAKLAQCHQFIDRLPEKYDTLIGDEGTHFSKGQEQRIAIARAILMDLPIYIFDEATANLDSLTEMSVCQAVYQRLRHQKTMLFITHRVQILNQTDRILVFDNGRIVEDGSFDNLIKQQGVFHQFLLNTRQHLVTS